MEPLSETPTEPTEPSIVPMYELVSVVREIQNLDKVRGLLIAQRDELVTIAHADGETFAAIAKITGISRQRIRQIIDGVTYDVFERERKAVQIKLNHVVKPDIDFSNPIASHVERQKLIPKPSIVITQEMIDNATKKYLDDLAAEAAGTKPPLPPMPTD